MIAIPNKFIISGDVLKVQNTDVTFNLLDYEENSPSTTKVLIRSVVITSKEMNCIRKYMKEQYVICGYLTHATTTLIIPNDELIILK